MILSPPLLLKLFYQNLNDWHWLRLTIIMSLFTLLNSIIGALYIISRTTRDLSDGKIIKLPEDEATQFKSILLLNEGNGKFKKIELPSLAQTMPILDSDTYDFNDDGYEDVIVVGNIYNTEVETPRLDNAFALVLLSNKEDGYNVIGPDKTGLYINGNAKSVKLIKQSNSSKVLVIIATNNGKAETFEFNNTSNY